MGVLLADKGLAGEQEGFGAGGKGAKHAGIEGNRFIRRGVADRAVHGPEFSLGSSGDHIDVDGRTGQ